MATEAVSTTLPVRPTKQTETHPLAPISADEIKKAVELIKSQWPSSTDLHFKAITLQEPNKAEAVPYIEAEYHGYGLPHIDRRVFVTYYLRMTVQVIDEVGLGHTVNILLEQISRDSCQSDDTER